MPQTLNSPMYAETTATPATGKPSGRNGTSPRLEQVSAPPNSKAVSHGHTNWPRVILAAGGSGAGAAFVGGSFGGPIGAIGIGALGVILGILIQHSQESS
jgi:hypothetical protein